MEDVKFNLKNSYFSSENPVLQVALDYGYLWEAEKTARIVHEEMRGLEYICEAGTPLIKNEGLKKVIPSLRNIVGYNTKIVADLKTMDTGAFEVELAYNAGADIVSIAGVSEKETIFSALEKAREYNVSLMIDTIGVENIRGRLEWIINKIKRHNLILEYHIPIDKQTSMQDFSLIKEIYDESGIIIAAAGGLDEHIIPRVVSYGAKICVVGGAITHPKNRTSRQALREIKKKIYL